MLTIDGERLNPLSVDDLQYYEARFFLVPGTGTVYIDAKLSVIRQRAVGDGFREKLSILNHDDRPVELEVRLEVGSDFADLFEVKDALEKKGAYDHRVEDGRLVLAYRREAFSRETRVSASAPAEIDQAGMTFAVHVEPHSEWTTDLQVVPAQMGLVVGEGPPDSGSTTRPDMKRGLDRWLADAPRLGSDWDWLRVTYDAASWTSLRSGSLRGRNPVRACRRRDCHGS